VAKVALSGSCFPAGINLPRRDQHLGRRADYIVMGGPHRRRARGYQGVEPGVMRLDLGIDGEENEGSGRLL